MMRTRSGVVGIKVLNDRLWLFLLLNGNFIEQTTNLYAFFVTLSLRATLFYCSVCLVWL